MPDTLTPEQKKAQTHEKANAFEVTPQKAESVRQAQKLPNQEQDIKTLWKGFSREKRAKIINDLSPEELVALWDQLGLGGHATDVSAAPKTGSPADLKRRAYNLVRQGSDFLPMAGGVAGGLAGGAATSAASPLASFAGKVGGSAVGGGLGEIARQAILHGTGMDKNDPESIEDRTQDVAKEALAQAGGEVAGIAFGRMLRPTLEKSLNKIAAAGDLGATDVEHLENVIGDLTKYEKMPGNKVMTVRDMFDLLNTAKRDIGNEVDLAMAQPINVNGRWTPLGQATANTQPITTEIQNLITSNPDLARGALGANPAWQQAVVARLRNYFKPRTFSELTLHRIKLNNGLRAMYDLPKGEQRAYLAAHPILAIDKAEADAIRDVIYPEMDKVASLPNGTTQRLQNKRGALMSLADTFDKQVKDLHAETRRISGKGVLERGNISTYGTSSGRPGIAVHRLTSIVHAPNPERSAGKKVKSAFGNTVGSKAGKAVSTPFGSKNAGDELLSLPLRYLTRPTASEPDDQDQETPGPQSSVSKSPTDLLAQAKVMQDGFHRAGFAAAPGEHEQASGTTQITHRFDPARGMIVPA